MDSGLHAALREAAREAVLSLNEYCVRKLAHPARPELAAAAGVTARAAEIAGSHLVGIVVFGSWARGAATESSDVDILVVVGAGLPLNRALYRQWDEAPLRWGDHRVEPHFVRLPGPEDRVSGLWAEVALDGVVLFEHGLELSRKLADLRAQIAEGRIVRRRSSGHPYWVTT